MLQLKINVQMKNKKTKQGEQERNSADKKKIRNKDYK